MNSSIIIIGGGAAGIFAALGAAHERELRGVIPTPSSIIILERNTRLGIKILISGGGKCNVTHEGPVESILREGFPKINEQRFLKSSFYRFTNNDVLRLLERSGVKYHARSNGRIFPDSGRAEDVLRAFESELERHNIMVVTNERVTNIEQMNANPDAQWRVETTHRALACNAVIITTGGVSYPKVGTTGDGINFARSHQHEIIPLRAALAPIRLTHLPPSELHGVALRNVNVSIMQHGKRVAQSEGDLLITHHGLSGPAILDVSRDAAQYFEQGSIEVRINLLGKDVTTIRVLAQELQQIRASQQLKTWLEEILPNRFAPYVLSKADIPLDRKWNALTREERNNLLTQLEGYSFGEVASIPIERGEVSAGGVSLKDVDPKTMMSKKLRGLFFAGEVLDIAGEIGGYNLQAAYSTGWVAGEESIKYLNTYSSDSPKGVSDSTLP